MAEPDRVDLLKEFRELLSQLRYKDGQAEVLGELRLFEEFARLEKALGAPPEELDELRAEVRAMYREHVRRARRRQRSVLARIGSPRGPGEPPGLPPSSPRQLPPGD